MLNIIYLLSYGLPGSEITSKDHQHSRLISKFAVCLFARQRVYEIHIDCLPQGSRARVLFI